MALVFFLQDRTDCRRPPSCLVAGLGGCGQIVLNGEIMIPNVEGLKQGGIRTWTVWGGHRGRCGGSCRNRCLEGAQKDFTESSGIMAPRITWRAASAPMGGTAENGAGRGPLDSTASFAAGRWSFCVLLDTGAGISAAAYPVGSERPPGLVASGALGGIAD